MKKIAALIVAISAYAHGQIIIDPNMGYEQVINASNNPAVHITLQVSGLTPGATNGLEETFDLTSPVAWTGSRIFTSFTTTATVSFTNANLITHPVAFFRVRQLP